MDREKKMVWGGLSFLTKEALELFTMNMYSQTICVIKNTSDSWQRCQLIQKT